MLTFLLRRVWLAAVALLLAFAVSGIHPTHAAGVFAPAYGASTTFPDQLGSTTMTIAFDGTFYWSSSGGGPSGMREAQYDASGGLVAHFAPGLDFRSVFTDAAGTVYARQYYNSTIYKQNSPGHFSSLLTLGGSGLDSQSSVVLNGPQTEYVAMSQGVVRRWSLDGTVLPSVTLKGYGVNKENAYPQNRGIAAVGSYWLTYDGSTQTLSAWDFGGNRVGTTVLTGAGNSFDSNFSLSYANNMAFIVDRAGGMWRGYRLAVQPLSLFVSDTLATPHALLTGTVFLDAPAPAGGTTISLSSNGPAATVPANVVVPEGAATATFPVMTQSIVSANVSDTPTPVTLSASDGTNSSTANLVVTPAAFARADTYVQDGANADANFGNAQTLLVSTDSSDGTGGNADVYAKVRFNRFHSIRRAWLRVYASVPGGGSAGLNLYAVPDTTWGQDTITYNNRPALGSVLKSVTVAGTGVARYDIDVTRYLQTSLAAGKPTVSLALHGPNVPTPLVNVLSKETQDLKPQLIIQGN